MAVIQLVQAFDRIDKRDTPEYSMNYGKSGFVLELVLPSVHNLVRKGELGQHHIICSERRGAKKKSLDTYSIYLLIQKFAFRWNQDRNIISNYYIFKCPSIKLLFEMYKYSHNHPTNVRENN